MATRRVVPPPPPVARQSRHDRGCRGDGDREPGQGVEDGSVGVDRGPEPGAGQDLDLEEDARRAQPRRHRGAPHHPPGGAASRRPDRHRQRGGPHHDQAGGPDGGEEGGLANAGRGPRRAVQTQVEVAQEQAREGDGEKQDQEAHSPAGQSETASHPDGEAMLGLERQLLVLGDVDLLGPVPADDSHHHHESRQEGGPAQLRQLGDEDAHHPAGGDQGPRGGPRHPEDLLRLGVGGAGDECRPPAQRPLRQAPGQVLVVDVAPVEVVLVPQRVAAGDHGRNRELVLERR